MLSHYQGPRNPSAQTVRYDYQAGYMSHPQPLVYYSPVQQQQQGPTGGSNPYGAPVLYNRSPLTPSNSRMNGRSTQYHSNNKRGRGGSKGGNGGSVYTPQDWRSGAGEAQGAASTRKPPVAGGRYPQQSETSLGMYEQHKTPVKSNQPHRRPQPNFPLSNLLPPSSSSQASRSSSAPGQASGMQNLSGYSDQNSNNRVPPTASSSVYPPLSAPITPLNQQHHHQRHDSHPRQVAPISDPKEAVMLLVGDLAQALHDIKFHQDQGLESLKNLVSDLSKALDALPNEGENGEAAAAVLSNGMKRFPRTRLFHILCRYYEERRCHKSDDECQYLHVDPYPGALCAYPTAKGTGAGFKFIPTYAQYIEVPANSTPSSRAKYRSNPTKNTETAKDTAEASPSVISTASSASDSNPPKTKLVLDFVIKSNRPCRYMAMNGECLKEDDCRFSHEIVGLKAVEVVLSGATEVPAVLEVDAKSFDGMGAEKDEEAVDEVGGCEMLGLEKVGERDDDGEKTSPLPGISTAQVDKCVATPLVHQAVKAAQSIATFDTSQADTSTQDIVATFDTPQADTTGTQYLNTPHAISPADSYSQNSATPHAAKADNPKEYIATPTDPSPTHYTLRTIRARHHSVDDFLEAEHHHPKNHHHSSSFVSGAHHQHALENDYSQYSRSWSEEIYRGGSLTLAFKEDSDGADDDDEEEEEEDDESPSFASSSSDDDNEDDGDGEAGVEQRMGMCYSAPVCIVKASTNDTRQRGAASMSQRKDMTRSRKFSNAMRGGRSGGLDMDDLSESESDDDDDDDVEIIMSGSFTLEGGW
ncbi:hypothetical protein HDV05_006139 [Chytridiales sp. JEL 0842]|nr:hypothetical protein HDV05_006139 [Chytridiales sp. JEL 0842]